MSDEQRQAEEDKLLGEWARNKRELDRLRVSAQRIGDVLIYVGQRLRNDPQRLVFQNESTPIQHGSSNVNPLITDTTGINLQPITEVRDAIRALMDRQTELEPRLRAFNLPTN